MVKKAETTEESGQATGPAPGGLFDSAFAGTIKESAQQIWLAGLGAFSKAQEEGGKVFDSLVKEGANLQKKSQSAAGEKLDEVTQKMTSMAGDVSAKAGQQWDKLESIFEDRTARAMSRLGVPMKKDVDAMVARIDELQAKLASMARMPVARKAAAKKAAQAAAGTKRTPRKRAP